MAGRHRRSSNLKFATRQRRRVPVRLLAFVAGLIVVVVAVILALAETSPVPALTVRRALPASVRFPGPPPAPAWPGGGEAAAEVQGLGSLGTSGPQKPVPIASVTKIMTAYVVLQDHPVKVGQGGFQVTISAADVADYKRRLAAGELVAPVTAGETINEVQLLQALLVASANNVAPVLADFDAGSVPAFVARMNAEAHRLGMTHTTYAGVSGISPATVSTAADQLKLAAAAMADPVFARTVAMTSATVPVAGVLANFNRAIGTGGYVGIKAGSDPTAGGCLVFANHQTVGGHPVTILGVVLGQAPGHASTALLAAAAQSAADGIVHSVTASLHLATILPAGSVVATVSNRQGASSPARTSAAVQAVGWGGLHIPVDVTLLPVGRTAGAGTPVARVSVASGTPASTTAGTAAPVPAVSFSWRVEHVL